jgi:hypothetical protein
MSEHMNNTTLFLKEWSIFFENYADCIIIMGDWILDDQEFTVYKWHHGNTER